MSDKFSKIGMAVMGVADDNQKISQLLNVASQMTSQLKKLIPDHPDIIAAEKVRTSNHAFTHSPQAIEVTQQAANPPKHYVELPLEDELKRKIEEQQQVKKIIGPLLAAVS